MRRLLLPLILVIWLTTAWLATACQASITSLPLTPASNEVRNQATSGAAGPTQSPTASIDFDAVFRRLENQMSVDLAVEPGLASDVQRALAAFLNSRADRRQSIDRQPTVIDDLRSALDVSSTGKPSVLIRDADGDGRLDVLVTLPAAGLPGFVIRHAPDGFVGYQVPSSPDQSTAAPVTIERVDDLNGDGVPEIVLLTKLIGASSVNSLITVARWTGQGFDTLLQTGVSDWAGQAGWEFVTENGSEALVTTCPALGIYDHKLLPHPELTRTFRWHDGELILDEVRLQPPETVRQQVNVAESAFQNGDVERALAAYWRAAEDTNLDEEDQTPNIAWRAYAQFRIGQIEALRGNRDAARQAMEKAAAAGPSLSDLATAFLDGFAEGNAARGLAAIQRVNLYEKFYFERGRNLGFPMGAADVLYPGLAVAAYLDVQPDAGRGSGEALTSVLRDLGLSVASSAIVDLDGAGPPEVVVVVNRTVPQELAPEGRQQSLWLLTHREQGWWPQRIEAAATLALTQTVPAPEEDGRRAVVYQRPENVSPREAAVSWDGEQILRYNVSAGEELVPVSSNSDLFQCTIP